MKKKTLIILAVLFAAGGGCCCLSGLFYLSLAEQGIGIGLEEPASASAAAPAAGGDSSLGGYITWGSATPIADGYPGSLVGNWMLMDGASSIESIESISEDIVRVRNNRSGELWHYSFEADGSYAYRYVVTYNRRAQINTEKGEWSTDGATLTLSPSSCTTRTGSEATDCLETNPRAYALSTVQLEELTPGDTKGVVFEGMMITGPNPKFASGANQATSFKLQRVR